MIGNKKKNLKGIGLMEMIISIGIFTISILVITQIFLKVNEGQRNIIAAQNVQENIKYILEVMSREIRNAVRDTSGACITIDKLYEETANTSLSFINQNGDCVEYGLANDANGISRLYIDRGSAGQVYITSDDIKVDSAWFEVDETNQEKVTIVFDVRSIGKEIDSQAMKIQTTISSRLYD